MTKTPATDQWKQNIDYELIPGENNHWKVRILKGDFIETVYHYGDVSFNDGDLMIKFDYTLDYSPDPELQSEDTELQKSVSGILHSILMGMMDDNQH